MYALSESVGVFVYGERTMPTIQQLLKDINQLSMDYESNGDRAVYDYLQLKIDYLKGVIKCLQKE